MLTLCIAGWAVALALMVTAGCLAVALRDSREETARALRLWTVADAELERAHRELRLWTTAQTPGPDAEADSDPRNPGRWEP